MHIPTADTDTLELLPFRDALEMSGRRGDYDAAPWLSLPPLSSAPVRSAGIRGFAGASSLPRRGERLAVALGT